MDKLKPILAQKFWILFSVGLILPIVGYFMTKGGLATEIETRRSKLKTTFDGIPQGIDSPNEQWINGALLENEKGKGVVYVRRNATQFSEKEVQIGDRRDGFVRS